MEPLFIDVREPLEFKLGHIKGAINIPPAKLLQGEPAELTNIPRDTPLILYCVSGSRSNASMPYFRNMGFTNLTNGINKDQVKRKYFTK
jgi:phage shock protein E